MAIQGMLAQGRYEEAFDRAQRLIKANPESPAVWAINGLAALLVGNEVESREAIAFASALPEPEQLKTWIFWTQFLNTVHRNRTAVQFVGDIIASKQSTINDFRICAETALSVPESCNIETVFDRWRHRFPEDRGVQIYQAQAFLRDGDLDAAADAARAALASPQDQGLALRLLSDLDPGLITGNDIAAAENARKSGELDAFGLACVGFALGKVYEEEKDFDRAFAEYEKGNQALGKEFEEAGVSYKHAAQTNNCGLLKTLTGRTQLTRTEGFVRPGDPFPIFIVGLPSSGTSLLEQILAGHSAVVACGERREMGEILNSVMRRRSQGQWRDGIPDADILAFRKTYLDSIGPDLNGCGAVTDKMPDNFKSIGLITELFPEAKILNIRRNAMDNCLSIYLRPFNHGYPYSTNLRQIASYCGIYENLMRHWHTALPGRIFDVSYEDIVEDAEVACRSVFDFCGLTWDASCLALNQVKRPVMTLSASQVRRPIYNSSVGRWKRFEKHLAPLIEGLAENAGGG